MKWNIDMASSEFQNQSACLHFGQCSFFSMCASGVYSEKVLIYRDIYCNAGGRGCALFGSESRRLTKYMLPNGRMYNPFTGRSICQAGFTDEHVREMEKVMMESKK